MTTEEQLQEIRTVYSANNHFLLDKHKSLLEQMNTIKHEIFLVREQKDKLDKETAKKILELYGIGIGQKVCVEGEQITITDADLMYSDLMKISFITEESEEFVKIIATSEQNIKETFNLKQ